jgi:acyl-CoA synthetase (AMP-forming)/AMP-acid ligase II
LAFVADFARQFPDRVAVVMNGDGANITYSELDVRSVRIANSLAQAGLGFGSAVGVLLENAIHTYEVMWACQRSGIR